MTAVEQEPSGWLGKSVKRKEDDRFIVGRGNYIEDIKLPNMLHMAILRSPFAHAKINSIDTTRASELPGVVVVVTGEILTEVRVRDASARAGGAYLKLERKVGDFATAAVGVHLSFSNGTVERAGIGLTAVGPTNLRASAAEESLVGKAVDDAAIEEASRLAAQAAEPVADVRGSVEFKRQAVRVLTARALLKAAQPTGEPESFSGHETIEGVMEEIREKEES